MTIAFVDTYAPRSYTPATMDDAHLGGSERSAMNIAEGLAKSGNIKVAFYQQHLTHEIVSNNGVIYRPLSALSNEKPGHVVVIRNIRLMQPIQQMFCDAKLFLVLDDLAQYCGLENYRDSIPQTIICKSKWHREHIYKAFKSMRLKPKIVYAYNPTIPIQDADECSSRDKDDDKLLYASSPHKGLDRALSIFKQLRGQIPTIQLHVANPGYLSNSEQFIDGVHYLGTVSYRALREHMATSLCLFHPNNSYPETFGCVFAEANMAGTPVLTHKLGAAKEVLLATKQQRQANAVIDTEDFTAVLSAIQRWRQAGNVNVFCPTQFTQESVVARWKDILGI